MRDWDTAYRKKGEIQTWIDKIVEDSVDLFKQRNVKRILDLGFGTGRHTIFLAEKDFDVYGIDISEKGKEITEQKGKEKNLNIHLVVGDMHDLPFEDTFFDAIIVIYTIHHTNLTGLKRIMSEVKRVLKPKGIFVGTLISTKDLRYGTGKKLEPDTFIGINEPVDPDVPHHFSDERKVKELFSGFNFLNLEEKTSFSQRRHVDSVHWEIIAEKK